MAFKVVRSRDAVRDLNLIFEHLVASYVNLGEAPADAIDHAAGRIRGFAEDMNAIANAPYQGTLQEKIAAGLRSVTKNRAVYYFTVDETAQAVQILAIFFGGQDHLRHMLKRLGGAD
jgi:plasmid stabilization system protein ParE